MNLFNTTITADYITIPKGEYDTSVGASLSSILSNTSSKKGTSSQTSSIQGTGLVSHAFKVEQLEAGTYAVESMMKAYATVSGNVVSMLAFNHNFIVVSTGASMSFVTIQEVSSGFASIYPDGLATPVLEVTIDNATASQIFETNDADGNVADISLVKYFAKCEHIITKL